MITKGIESQRSNNARASAKLKLLFLIFFPFKINTRNIVLQALLLSRGFLGLEKTVLKKNRVIGGVFQY